MSHVVCSKVRIDDLEILKKVIAEHFPQLKWHEGVTNYKWYGQYANDYHAQDAAYHDGIKPENYGKCSHMVAMNGVHYQIGIVDRGDGTYTLIWDFYDDGATISEYIGKGAEKLMSAYSQEYINQWAERNGFMMEETIDDEGNIVLTMSSST